MAPVTAASLQWIEHLPEVGSPLLRQRDSLLELIAQIEALQKIARRRQQELDQEVAELWMPIEIQMAKRSVSL